MTRSIHKLTPMAIEKQKMPGKYADGGGLYLVVADSGAKTWVFRYMFLGKRREMGLGTLQVITLKEARSKAADCRKLLADGQDPIEDRKATMFRIALEAASAITFKEAAETYIKAHKVGWRNAKHIQQWENTLATYVYPVFGQLSVGSIDVGLVMKVLEPLWQTKTETASRLRGRIEAILDWAAARGYRSGENPARWRGHLQNLLPRRAKVQRVQHHKALPYAETGAFMQEVRKSDVVAAKALEFVILTATRTSETIGATWDEIDFKNKVWTIPASRIKASREHKVPLTAEALAILEAMKETRVSDYVFPGGRAKNPLSNMAMLKFLDRMERSELTVHGFRSTFRDWAAEQTNFPREVAEMALAHAVSDKVEAAYRRGDLFEKRRKLMEGWARYCHTLPSEGGKILKMKKKDAVS